MKFGFVCNAGIRDGSGGLYERFIKSINSAKLDAIFLNGGYSDSGYYLIESIQRDFQNRGIPVFTTLGPRDFRNEDCTILKTIQNLESAFQNNKKDQFFYLPNCFLPLKDTVFTGANGWFDGIDLAEENDPDEFHCVPDLMAEKDWKAKINVCNNLAKNMAEHLAFKLEEAYTLKPKKIIIFTPLPGSIKSTNFGGLNIIPKNVRGMYINRFIYPAIKNLVSNHRSIKHTLISGSPFGNNTNMIAPNFKEIVCLDTFRNKSGQKEIGLHILSI